jgi:hypothetical protein
MTGCGRTLVSRIPQEYLVHILQLYKKFSCEQYIEFGSKQNNPKINWNNILGALEQMMYII